MQRKNKGFTLVELSIVLVIIGLIVGGVVSGQALIKSARVSAIASDFTKYQTAYRAFKLQYDAVPGDFAEATSYWPSATTANGSGDGTIGEGGGGFNERFYVWQHMALAEVVSGSYSGGRLSSGTHYGGHGMGVNAPAAGIRSGCFILASEISGNNFPNTFGLYNCEAQNSGLFPPAMGKTIDKKLDDGDARTGILRGFESRIDNVFSATCSGSYGGNYNVSSTANSCVLLYFTAKVSAW